MLSAPYDVSKSAQQEELMLPLTGSGSQRVLRDKRNGENILGLAPRNRYLCIITKVWDCRSAG